MDVLWGRQTLLCLPAVSQLRQCALLPIKKAIFDELIISSLLKDDSN